MSGTARAWQGATRCSSCRDSISPLRTSLPWEWTWPAGSIAVHAGVEGRAERPRAALEFLEQPRLLLALPEQLVGDVKRGENGDLGWSTGGETVVQLRHLAVDIGGHQRNV